MVNDVLVQESVGSLRTGLQKASDSKCVDLSVLLRFRSLVSSPGLQEALAVARAQRHFLVGGRWVRTFVLARRI